MLVGSQLIYAAICIACMHPFQLLLEMFVRALVTPIKTKLVNAMYTSTLYAATHTKYDLVLGFHLYSMYSIVTVLDVIQLSFTQGYTQQLKHVPQVHSVGYP